MSSTPKTTPKKLDSLSREDLMLKVKQQIVLLQKLKGKYEEGQSKLKTAQEEKNNSESKSTLLSEENTQLKATADELRKNNASLQSEMECLNMKQDSVSESFAKMQQELDALSSENKNLHSTALSDKENVEKLSDQLRSQKEQNSKLLIDIKNINDNVSALQSSLTTVESEKKTLSSELSAMKITVDMFKQNQQSNDTKDNIVADLKTEVSVCHDKIRSLEEQNDKKSQLLEENENSRSSLQSSYSALEIKLKTLENDITQILKERDDAIGNHQQAIAEYDSKVSILEKNCKELDTLKLDLSKQNESILEEKLQNENELKNCEEKLKKVTTDFETQSKEFESITASLESLQKKNDEFVDQIQLLSEAATARETENKELAANLEALQSTAEKATEDKQQSNSELEGTITQLNLSINQLKSDLDEANKNNHQLSVQLDELKSTNDAQENELHTLMKNNESMNVKLQDAENTISATNDELQSKSCTIDQLNDTISTERASKQELESKVGLIQSQSVSLTDFESIKQELDKVSTEKVDLETAVAELKSSAEKHHHESTLTLQTTTEKLHDSEKECSQLRDQLEHIQNAKSDDDSAASKLNEDQQAEVDRLNQIVNELQTQCNDFITQIDEFKATNKKYEQEQIDLMEQVKSLTQELEKAKLVEEQLQQSAQSSKEEESTQSDEVSSKLDALQKTIEEKTEQNLNLKKYALKMKKDVQSLNQQLQAANKENSQLQAKLSGMEKTLLGTQTQASNVQMMQAECDKLQDQLDSNKEEKVEMQKTLDSLTIQLRDALEESGKLEAQVSQLTFDLESLNNSKKDLDTLLSSTKASVITLDQEKDTLSKDLRKVKNELEEKVKTISTLNQTIASKETEIGQSKIRLEKAMSDLEHGESKLVQLCEYENTIQELQVLVKEKDELIETNDSEMQSLNEKIKSLQIERTAAEQLNFESEERIQTAIDSLNASRLEVERLTELDAEMQSKYAASCDQVENMQQQLETGKLELSSKASELSDLQSQFQNSQATNSSHVNLLERKIDNLSNQVTAMKAENEKLTSDYESYKVRVHTVLKQQKNKEGKQEERADDSEVLRLKKTVDQLQMNLQQSQNALSTHENELELLQNDYDRLLVQQQQSSESAVEREGRWKSRVKTLQQELNAVKKEHDDVIKRMTQQRDLVASSNMHEIANLQMKHEEEVTELQKQLEMKEDEIARLNVLEKKTESTQSAAVTSTPIAKRLFSMPRRSSHDSLKGLTLINDDDSNYDGMTREEGEGEEHPRSPSMISLEKLIEGPAIQSTKVLSRTESIASTGMHVKHLETKLSVQNKQLKHLSEVARENESAAARLTDQNKVLKDEIRRLEKNQERETEMASMEYLKNVMFKFVTLPPCDEKHHLVTVMDTLLKLTVQEKNKLVEVAQGEDVAAQQGGWGSYLQRWSGM